MLASLNDINLQLPDGVSMPNGQDTPYQVDAEAVIRGYLASVIDRTTLAQWTSPETTPLMIRGIAGRFIASEWYGNKTGQNSQEASTWASTKYKEAMGLLMDIVRGVVDLELDTDTSNDFTSDDFYPNDGSGVESIFKLSDLV
jgi:hypothetical protein